MLQSMGSQTAGHNLANEQQQQMAKMVNFMLRVFYYISSLCAWVLSPQIRPATDQKYLEKKNFRKFPKANFEFVHTNYLHTIHTVLTAITWHLYCIRYVKQSRDDFQVHGSLCVGYEQIQYCFM